MKIIRKIHSLASTCTHWHSNKVPRNWLPRVLNMHHKITNHHPLVTILLRQTIFDDYRYLQRGNFKHLNTWNNLKHLKILVTWIELLKRKFEKQMFKRKNCHNAQQQTHKTHQDASKQQMPNNQLARKHVQTNTPLAKCLGIDCLAFPTCIKRLQIAFVWQHCQDKQSLMTTDISNKDF